MKLLLDTHILLAWVDRNIAPGSIQRALDAETSELFVSVATLWEIAIKSRLGKLHLSLPLDALPDLMRDIGLVVIPIEVAHAITTVEPEPPTRDPFDRLLLAQCQVEGLRLVTLDCALAAHRLAFKP